MQWIREHSSLTRVAISLYTLIQSATIDSTRFAELIRTAVSGGHEWKVDRSRRWLTGG